MVQNFIKNYKILFHILQGSLISKRVNFGYGTSCNVPDFLLLLKYNVLSILLIIILIYYYIIHDIKFLFIYSIIRI